MRGLAKKLSVVTCCVMLFLSPCVNKKIYYVEEDKILIRDVDLNNTRSINQINERYSSYNISDDDNIVSFNGIMNYDENTYNLIDSISDTNISDDNKVKLNCSFNFDTMQFILDIELYNKEGLLIESLNYMTDAFVTENGGLDGFVELDENTSFYISDYFNDDFLENCGLFGWIVAAVVTVIVVYVIVAETAEQIKAKNNYEYNKELEAQGNGVNSGIFITNQSETGYKGRNAGNYRFGFTKFSGVGCEVAAAYNLMISLGKSERLSETINSFEKLAIEYSIAWGNFGSSPNAIYRYLNNRDLGYTKINNFSEFSNKVNEYSNCHIIMSRWNNPLTTGLHTFYVRKNSSSSFDSYNWQYRTYSYITKSSLSDFNNGSGFIVGYIVWNK